MKNIAYETYRLDWKHLEIEVRYSPDWGMGMAHIEIETVCRSPLPITETGCRSHFTNTDLIEEFGGPVAFVEAWLEERTQEMGGFQLSLLQGAFWRIGL